MSHLIRSLERFSQVTKLLALSHCLRARPNDGDNQEMTRNVDIAMEYAAACEAAASHAKHRKDELRQYVQTAEAVQLLRELGVDAVRNGDEVPKENAYCAMECVKSNAVQVQGTLDEDVVTSRLTQLLAICESARDWLCTSIVENPCLSFSIFEHLYNKVERDKGGDGDRGR